MIVSVERTEDVARFASGDPPWFRGRRALRRPYTPRVLVGRSGEVQILEDLLDRARSGLGGVLAFVGDVGMGKSALLDHAAQLARDMNVLRARGVESEARVPFGSLLELLRPALGHLDALAPPQREALESALALRPGHAQDRFAVGAATLGLLAAYAEDVPLLVLVDDAHWVDGSSAEALLFASRRLVADPVAIVLAVRAGEPSLLDGSDLPVHALAGLDRDATAALVSRTTAVSGDDVIERLHRGTGGNPLALVELASDPASLAPVTAYDAPLPVSTRVAAVYLDRYDALPERARDVVLLAAASGTGDLRTLAAAAEHLGLTVADLAPAEDGALVAVRADRVEWRHPLARSAVYAAASPERCRAVHRALADVLPDADADRRAWHLALASIGPDEAASAALEEAARRARERSAYDVASHALARAADLSVDGGRRARLLYAAADAAWLAGRTAEPVAFLNAAACLHPEPHVAARIEHLRGHIATRLGPVTDAQRILLAGAAAVSAVDPERAVVMLADAVNAAFYGADAGAMAEAAARIAALDGTGMRGRAAFLAAMAQGMARIFAGHDAGDGASLVREAVALVEESDELGGDPRLLAWAAMGPLWLREADAGRALVTRALDAARRQSAAGVLPFLLCHIAVDDVATDRWAEGRARLHEAIELAREAGQRTDLEFALARLAWLDARQGREDDCRAHAAEARALAREVGANLGEIWSLAALGELELGLGRLDAAVASFEEQRGVLDAQGVRDADLSPDGELVELNSRLGRRERAALYLADFERDATAKGQPWALARAARCRAQLAPDDDIDRHFADALALHAQTPDVFETARTRLAYGARLRRARRRVDARDELRAAIDVFDALGAVPWSETARAEYAATGETARRRDVSTRDQLTPQELQVALSLAEGRTTREAAAALFLSPKTVEYHLRNVYRKLGINSREQLTAVMTG